MKKLILIFMLINSAIILPQKLNYQSLCTQNSDSTIVFKRLNINNITTSFSNNGLSDYNLDDIKGFIYPKDHYNPGFWFSGFLWGGKINGEVRVSGTTYRTSLQPAGDNRIYRVRRDYKNGDLSSEINDNEGTESNIRNEYEVDWYDWPGNDGAPFEDIDKNGSYDPDIDIPGFPGADQTIWFKANDFDSLLVNNIFGSLPLGIELEATYWAYNTSDPLANAIFRKYKITNISTDYIADMFCGITTDPDIGDTIDDYVGCDTLLNLAFAYNAFNTDFIFNNHPPALGYILLQGPIIENNMLSLSSFNFIINVDAIYGYPALGDYENGAIAFYNLFDGILKTGTKYPIPVAFGGGETAYPFSGNPVTGEGWIEHDFPPGNRNMGLSTGPFNLAPDESQEIVFAQIAAGGIEGVRRDEGINLLKINADHIIKFYKNLVDTSTGIIVTNYSIPSDFKLFQNYPNPFNPTTTIEYSIPELSSVSLKIFNNLGQQLFEFNLGDLAAGNYRHNITLKRFSSGIYFYQLSTNRIRITKKMLLLK